MLSFRFACKNILRNARYSLALFLCFLLVSILSVSFFLFSGLTNDVYDSLLEKQVSSSYVSLNLNTGEGLVDLTTEEKEEIQSLEYVTGLEKFAYYLSTSYLSVGGGKQIDGSFDVILPEKRNVPDFFAAEYSALYSCDYLLCGRKIEAEHEILLSDAFVSLVGANSAEELLGQELLIKDVFQNQAVSGKIVGILKSDLKDISAMENKSKYFIFSGIDSAEEKSLSSYYYLIYSNFASLPNLLESLQDMSIDFCVLSLGNESYSLRRFDETSRFISAVLALMALLLLAAFIAFLTGASLFKFSKNRTFYFAAFAVGFSKNKLFLSFLFEFFILGFAAFLVSVPIGIFLVRGLTKLIFVFVGLSFEIKLEYAVVFLSLIPLAMTALISGLFVRSRLLFT